MAKRATTPAQDEPEGGNTPLTDTDSGAAGEGVPTTTTQTETTAIADENSQESGAVKTGTNDPKDTGEGDDSQLGTPDAPYGLKADGTPAAKRGPKPKSATDEGDKQRARLRSVTPAKPQVKKVQAVEVTPLAVVNYQAMGESVASMWFHGGEMLLGDEWAPDTQAGEHLAVAGAFRDYFKSINARDLPPGFALCFVLGVYSLKRATKPTIKSRLVAFGLWVKSKMPKRLGG